MHPRRLRCSSLKYSRYSRSSRLAGGAPRPSRCDARLSPRAANPKPSVGGTIAGIAMTTDETVRLPGRQISAIEVTTGSRYDSTTASNGGYTIKVPEGTYRLEIELRAGEALAKR